MRMLPATSVAGISRRNTGLRACAPRGYSIRGSFNSAQCNSAGHTDWQSVFHNLHERALSTLQYRLDSFHHAVIELMDDFACFHIFPNLLRLRCASDNRAYVRIFQAPREREFWQGNSEIARYLCELLHFPEPSTSLVRLELLAQPGVDWHGNASVARVAFVVLPGEQAGGKG